MTDYLTMSDEQLLKLYGDNCPQALEALTARYMKTARGIASTLGVTPDEIPDFVQEGMIGFLSAVYSYEEGSRAKFSTYAFACIRNRMLSVLRKSAAKGNIPPALTVSYEEQSSQLLNELTPEEQEERAVLRRKYIDSFKLSLTSQLDVTYIVDEKGNKTKVERKGKKK